jgi:hypothetical protein
LRPGDDAFAIKQGNAIIGSDPEFHAVAKDGVAVRIRAAEGIVEVGGREFRAEAGSRIARTIQEEGGIVPAVQRHGKHTFDALTAGAAR